MKTYYDLSLSEKKKYKKEFKSTPGGKDIWIQLTIIQLLSIAFLATCIFIDTQTNSYFSINVLFIIILVEEACKLVFNINFTAWLKNKHNIKRW
ncbi:MAG: hypothetical protein IJO43_00630 [Bacilli bacterium]|nr:hypothetical protein [Bacilli bacterium]